MAAQTYKLDSKAGLETISQGLCETFPNHDCHEHHFSRSLLDSFDWRLFNAGYYLIADRHDHGFELQLYELADQQLLTQVYLRALPRLRQDLGESKLAILLGPILDIRALLKQIELDVQQRRIQILNNAGKTQAEILVERCKTNHNDTPHQFKQLRHIDLKGYAKINQQVADHLQKTLALKPKKQALLTTLIDQLGIDTQYNTKPNIKLDAQGASAEQAKRLLTHFFNTMQKNHAGVIDDLDTEFLHDFRIAVRRSRTLLGQVPDIIPARQLSSFQRSFAQLGDITTPLRDLDVMQLNFDDYRNLLPTEMRAQLEPAYRFVCAQRQQAYNNLCKHLNSKTHARFCQRWHNFLAQEARPRRQHNAAERPTLDIANQRIWKVYKRSLKQGRAITSESPADDLHRLRKTCKKLRYLMEFYQSLYPTKSIKRLIKVLKQLQDNLGEFQDLHVHIDFFHELESAMRQQQCLDDKTEQALAVLQQALDKQQQAVRDEFFGRFKDFSNTQHQGWFRELFKQ